MENLYSKRSNLVIGFHGCDRSTVERMRKGGMLDPSTHDYDWLGHGAYFWQNNIQRAWNFAEEVKERTGKIKEPAVLGAVIDLGHCLDLIDSESLQFLKDAYEVLCKVNAEYGIPLPKNVGVRDSNDKVLRKLDCAVIEMAHAINNKTLSELIEIIDASKCLASNLNLMLNLKDDLTEGRFQVITLRLCINLLKTLKNYIDGIYEEKKLIVQGVYKDIIISLHKAIKALDIIKGQEKVIVNKENVDLLNDVVQKLETIKNLFTNYDSVRGVFWEGEELYPGAGFLEKNHIQICVRNPNCIKGFFLPREIDKNYPNP
jgi:hypothetical protein